MSSLARRVYPLSYDAGHQRLAGSGRVRIQTFRPSHRDFGHCIDDMQRLREHRSDEDYISETVVHCVGAAIVSRVRE